MIQYNIAIILAGDKAHEGLGLKSLADRRWSRKLTFFHKIILGRLQTVPSGISKLIQQRKNLLSLIFNSKENKNIFRKS